MRKHQKNIIGKKLILKLWINRKIHQGAVQQLNDIFKEAEIDNKVLAKLGDGMKKLSVSASNMGDVMDGTKKYNKQMTKASDHLEKINDLYLDQIKSFNTRMKVTEKMTDNLTASLEHSSRLSVEISNLSNNLNALNGCLWKYTYSNDK